jgi:hypothetical protein
MELTRSLKVAPPEEHRDAWRSWRDACQELEDLEIRIGADPSPVGDFTIDAGGSIAWKSASGFDFTWES